MNFTTILDRSFHHIKQVLIHTNPQIETHQTDPTHTAQDKGWSHLNILLAYRNDEPVCDYKCCNSLIVWGAIWARSTLS